MKKKNRLTYVFSLWIFHFPLFAKNESEVVNMSWHAMGSYLLRVQVGEKKVIVKQ